MHLRFQRASRAFRRSLFVVKDVVAGEPFTTENIRSIRPGHGLPPYRLEEVLGRVAQVDISAGTPLSASLFGGVAPDNVPPTSGT